MRLANRRAIGELADADYRRQIRRASLKVKAVADAVWLAKLTEARKAC